MTEFSERLRVKAIASQLQTDLQQARSAAVAADEVLRLEFANDGLGGCYVLHNGSSGQCSCTTQPGTAVCTGGATARGHFTVGGRSGMQLRSNVTAMAFSPSTGTVTPTGTLRVASERVGSVNLVVNVMGRVRTCSTDGMPGYRPC